MADRRVKVVFSAEVQNFKRAMEESAKATEKTAKASEDAGKKSEQSNKKSQEATKQTADEIAKLAAAHQDAAKAANLQYSSGGQLVDMNGKMLSSQQAAAHGLDTFSKEAYLAGQAAEEVARAEAEAAKAAEELAASTSKADSVLQEIVASATENSAEWEELGGILLGVGAAATVGLGLAAKAAMDWESAWAGVTKTVDGTPEQMDELEASLRGLAKTLPATHEEIAGVAEAAGQLGVKREDVVGFTETMIALGETTNLSADEAATAIAQISNVMGTMEREGSEGVERFSATLVALGNAGASTEAEIVAMAQRIAGAGKLVGASESDVLALANAMASVGIEAQLGGGVMSRVMQRMYADVKTGGGGLENLAKVAGVSSKEFATAFETDPVRAVDAVVQGLNKVKESGGNVIETMADLGIKGTEETSVILRLAGAGDLLTESLTLGDSAWKSNSALAEEAAKRYETTEAKVQIAWNNITDAAIDAGAVLLPIIAGMAEGVAGMAQAFGALPGPVKGGLTVLGGVVGVAALGAGAFLSLTPKVLDAMSAFNKLAPAGGKARGALLGVGKAAGGAMVIAGLALVLAKIAEADYMSKIDTGMGRVSLALIDVAKNSPGAAAGIDSLFKDRDGGDLINGVDDLGDALTRTFNKNRDQEFNDWAEGIVNGATGVKGSSQILSDSFDRIDKGLADMVSSGKSEDAAKNFDLVAKAAKDRGISIEELVTKFPAYGDALKQAEADGKAAGEGGDAAAAGIDAAGDAAAEAEAATKEIADALKEVGLSADGAVTDIEKFTAVLFNAGLISLSASDASIGYQAAIDAMTESVKTNGKSLDINTEKGRANQSAFNGLAQAAMTSATATATETLATEGSAAAQKQLQGSLKTSYDSLVTAAGQLGITGDAADTMARKALGIPKTIPIDTWVNDRATAELERIKGKTAELNGKTATVTIGVNTVYTESGPKPDGYVARNGIPAFKATGGKLLGYTGGGKLPSTGPGTEVTDGFLAINSQGRPVAMVDKDEWIINGDSSNRYNRELAAINAGTFPKLPGYANGSRAREYSAGSFAGSAGASNVTVSAPAVTVVIGGEKLDQRMYSVAGSAIASADSNSQFTRRGRS